MIWMECLLIFFSSNHTAPTEIYTLSLHDALPISEALASSTALYSWVFKILGMSSAISSSLFGSKIKSAFTAFRSEEHTSELQSRRDLVCRLLLEKKNTTRM